jgi:molybdopterin molybdotransferase
MTKVPPIPLEEAQARLLALTPQLPIEQIDPEAAMGRYLAGSLLARRTQPPTDLSAMDGYAVAPGELAGPWQVIGESAAGHPYAGTLLAGQAVRIATGAILPESAGAVILQEDISRDGDRLVLTGDAPVPPHKHIRAKGVDFSLGSQVLEAGVRIGPAQVALALSAGHSLLPVYRRPRVAIIDSGDELAAVPELCRPDQIPASNGAMLSALARTLPCDVIRLGPVADTMPALAAAFTAAEDVDVIVTSGGASVGDHDLIKPALAEWGADIDFWRVAIKPGKPILVATRESGGRRQIVLGLPGNPVSSYVTAFFFMLPLLRTLLGATQPFPIALRTQLAAPIKANGLRREFIRAAWDGRAASPQPVQDSGALTSLAGSNVLIDRPAHAPAGAAGDEVDAFLLENGGLA